VNECGRARPHQLSFRLLELRSIRTGQQVATYVAGGAEPLEVFTYEAVGKDGCGAYLPCRGDL
jgi:hypothetical protein